ncbi:uncharacterized protein LOC101858749 [Aplysia californica]|uniref:Uncharacterized protein LOC101858749 n=1 Tax=Aplysia californica TaxID=6500 RepID=A0ABM0K826_APLCA|nr:uncharacterized protein LOC101858749 [Aplysia californica]
MPRLSHECYGLSSPDQNGFRHKLSMDPSKQKTGDCYVTYKARANSEGKFSDPRHDAIVVAKFPLPGQESRKWTQREMDKFSASHQMAQKFNMFLTCVGAGQNGEGTGGFRNDLSSRDEDKEKEERDGIISFLPLQTNSLSSVSFLDKSRKVGDCFVFEDKLKNFQTFVGSNGQASAVERPKRGIRSVCFKRSRKRSGGESDSSSAGRERSSSNSSAEWACGERDQKKEESMTYVHSSSPPPHDVMLMGGGGRLPTYEESEMWTKYGAPPLWCPPIEYYYHHVLGGDFNNNPVYIDCSAQDAEVLNKERNLPGGSGKLSGRGRSLSVDSCQGEDSDDLSHAHLHAFIHHFFCHSHGQQIISNLRGACQKGGAYVLSTPTIHSVDRSFGACDEGVEGMREVIRRHVCSRYCRHLPDMEERLQRNLEERQ